MESEKIEAELVLKKLKQVTLICTVFIILEILGGILAHSIAIISDALHLFSDVIAFILSAFAVWLSTQPPPSWLAFGYHKIQPLGAFLNVVIIYIVTAYLFVEATERIINKEKVQNPLYMLITSLFGLGCNLVMMKILHSADTPGGHQCCSHGHNHGPTQGKRKQSDEELQKSGDNQSFNHDHIKEHNYNQIDMIQRNSPKSFENIHTHHQGCSHDHHHDHDHGHSSNQSHDHNHHQHSQYNLHQHSNQNRGVVDSLFSQNTPQQQNSADIHQNLNIQAAYAHILGDIILSVGVALAAIVIFFFTQQDQPYSLVHLADPLCTYFFSILVLVVTVPVLKRSVVVLLDGSINSNITFRLKKDLQKIEITEYSNLKVWSITPNQHLGSLSFSDRILQKSQVEEVKQIFQKRNVKLFIQA